MLEQVVAVTDVRTVPDERGCGHEGCEGCCDSVVLVHVAADVASGSCWDCDCGAAAEPDDGAAAAAMSCCSCCRRTARDGDGDDVAHLLPAESIPPLDTGCRAGGDVEAA